MKRNVVILTCLFICLLIPVFIESQEEKKGTCMVVMDKEKEVCVDFQTSWYYSVQFPTGWLITVRTVNSQATPHIWNEGQHFISLAEMEKLKTSLSSQGLSIVCPPPDYRSNADKLKTREQLCKK